MGDLLQTPERIGMLVLAFARVTGVLAASPVLGNRNIPMPARVALSLILTILCLPLIPAISVTPEDAAFVPALLAEAMLGALLGLIGTLLFAAAEFGGQVAGTQMGFAIANILSPESEQQVSVFSSMVSLIAILVFVTTDAHHLFITALVKSFGTLPLGGFVLTGAHQEGLLRMSTNIFIYGLALAAPVLCVTIFITVALGILSRSMPQFDVFFMGYGISLAAGFLVFIAAIPFVLALIQRLIDLMDSELIRVLGSAAR